MKCPLCLSESKFAFEVKGYSLLDCLVCSHRFAKIEADEQHVTETYGNSYFNDGGAGYPDYLVESKLLRARGRMYAKKIERFSDQKGRVLDVGAAAGFILQGFVDEGWSGMGIEPNSKMAKYGRETYVLNIQEGPFESFGTDEKFDLISMIQVAAHFYQQRKAFENAANLLKDDGLLLIETWNRASTTAKLLGKNWPEYAPPSVLHWFSKNGLTKFLNDFGFEKIGQGRPSKKISGKHAKSLLKHSLGNTFFLNLIPEKVNFPYPAEDLFWALYRKKGR